jgi:hypothetical protein
MARDKPLSDEARIILDVAVIDDILGLLILARVFGIAQAADTGHEILSASVIWMIAGALLFFAWAIVARRVIYRPMFPGKQISAFGVVQTGRNRVNRWIVGLGMIPRGEVGLISRNWFVACIRGKKLLIRKSIPPLSSWSS